MFLDLEGFRIGAEMGRNRCSGDYFKNLVVWVEEGSPYEFLPIKKKKDGDHEQRS